MSTGGGTNGRTGGGATGPDESRPRNVVVLCLDTVRRDFFDAFAPRLRDRANVAFGGCRAASAWSTPSHASMLTGRLPHQHGVHTYDRSFDRLSREDTFLGDLPDHRAVGVSANVYAGSAHGFDGLFDEFVDVSRYRRFPDAADPTALVDRYADAGPTKYLRVLREIARHERPGESLANLAVHRANDLVRHGPLDGRPELFDDGARPVERAALDRVDEEPYVLFCNVMDAHEPHRAVRGYPDTGVAPEWSSEGFGPADVIADLDAHADDVRNYRTLYAAAVDYLDRWAVSFAERLMARSDRETTVVVTADHGENLAYPADEGLFGHLSSLSEGVLHVPLVVLNAPETLGRVEGFASHLDLGELVVGLANGTVPDVTRDRAVAELVGPTPGNDALSGERWTRMRRCAYEGDRKWVWDESGGTVEYAHDARRPCWQERREASSDRPAWADERFDEAIEPYAERARSNADERAVDPDVERRLADLGYR